MTKKSLGQHWLFDSKALNSVLSAAEINSKDTVLEIGSGLGTLTELLLEKAKEVIAVEKDEKLAKDLTRKLSAENLDVIAGDILEFDLRKLPPGYKVAANIPYYITSQLLRYLLESSNPPSIMSLLLQKEVAERVAAGPGRMSVLAVSVQYYAQVQLIQVVPKELFSPPPKVDSAVIQIRRRSKPSFDADAKKLFRLVKAGFSEKRKKLKNSLAGGLRISDASAISLLKEARLNGQSRPQELSINDWQKIYAVAVKSNLL